MNSRAWTEPATEREARSVGRWVQKAAAPIFVRYLVLILLVVAAVLVYGELFAGPVIRTGPCGFGCQPPETEYEQTLLDRLF
jgi:hypothetical protein